MVRGHDGGLPGGQASVTGRHLPGRPNHGCQHQPGGVRLGHACWSVPAVAVTWRDSLAALGILFPEAGSCTGEVLRFR